MKRLLCPLFCCAAIVIADAQTLSGEVRKYQQDAAYRNRVVQKLKALKQQSDTGIVKSPALPYYLVNPKPGIHRLPQDNLPCLVPDMNATVAIPNGWKKEKQMPFRGVPPRIPNPAKPFHLSPSRPLLTDPGTEKTK